MAANSKPPTPMCLIQCNYIFCNESSPALTTILCHVNDGIKNLISWIRKHHPNHTYDEIKHTLLYHRDKEEKHWHNPIITLADFRSLRARVPKLSPFIIVFPVASAIQTRHCCSLKNCFMSLIVASFPQIPFDDFPVLRYNL